MIKEPLSKSRLWACHSSCLSFFVKLHSNRLKHVSISARFSHNLPEKILRNTSTRFTHCFLKRIIAVLVAAFVLLLSGCGKNVVNDQSDEIRLSSWEAQSGKLTACLSFDGDRAELNIVSPDDSTQITGLCLFDDSRLLIIDETKTYSFGYTLSGKTLTLRNDYGNVNFVKSSY